MKKAYVFLADGFEEVEALAPIDILRRAKVDVVTVSIMGKKAVCGAHKIVIEADTLFEELAAADNFADADLFVLPGGGRGCENLAEHAGLDTLIRNAAGTDTYLSAICASPSVFGRKGLLKDREATCYPGFEDRMPGAKIKDASVVHDGQFITARGMGVSVDFALKLAELLTDKAVADRIGGEIQDERYL